MDVDQRRRASTVDGLENCSLVDVDQSGYNYFLKLGFIFSFDLNNSPGIMKTAVFKWSTTTVDIDGRHRRSTAGRLVHHTLRTIFEETV